MVEKLLKPNKTKSRVQALCASLWQRHLRGGGSHGLPLCLLALLFCCDFGSILLAYWPGVVICETLLASTLEFVILCDFTASWKAKRKEAKQTRIPSSKARFSHALEIMKLVSFA